jgi:hypothetical protein
MPVRKDISYNEEISFTALGLSIRRDIKTVSLLHLHLKPLHLLFNDTFYFGFKCCNGCS